MANVLGIITAIVLAIAAFVAFKNKGAYEAEIVNRTGEQEKLAASNERLETAKADLAANEQQLTETQAEVERSKTQQAAQEAANTALSAEIEAKRPELEANKAKLDGIKEQTASLGDINNLAAKMRTMLTEREELNEAAAAAQSRLNTVTAESSRIEAVVAEQKSENELLAKGDSFPNLNTTVRAVYPNWGFVTLGAGNNSGVVTNSTLDVIRNGEPIAKLLVTAVESNTSSASIIPDSVTEGTQVAPGDRVVPGVKISAPARTSN